MFLRHHPRHLQPPAASKFFIAFSVFTLQKIVYTSQDVCLTWTSFAAILIGCCTYTKSLKISGN